VRLICKHCKEEVAVTPDELRQIGLKPEDSPTMRLWRGRGCPHCLNSGYLDRTAIYEIFTVNDHVRDQIMAKTGVTQIKSDALKRGMRTLRMDGARKVLKGQTTVEEVLRVTQMDTF
jgi:type II secretory ATPase GspE/PulE/Tfp pilus assembly ATPase PilB-like protein